MRGQALVEEEREGHGWSDSSARAVLQLMVHSVAEMIGFEVAALSVVLEGQLVTVAYTGPEEFRAYLEQPDPVSVLDPILERAQSCGRLRFLAAEDNDVDLEGHWVSFDTAGGQGPDAWHQHDALMALLSDDDDRLVGVLSVDRPVSGLRPDEVQQRLLERYAAQAERAVLTAFEREELVRRVAHAEAARRLIRSASMPAQASLEAVLDHTHRPLVEGFGASGSWIQLVDPEGEDRGRARTHDGTVIELSERMVELAHLLAPRLWADQRVLVLGENEEEGAVPEELGSLPDVARQQLADLGLARALCLPLGVGSQCHGFLVLTRRALDPVWSAAEMDSALQIGHDLGAALMTARALERERALVQELQQLDDHRTQLISTLSHELRTPLTVISGNLEMLDDLDLGYPATRYREAMTRGTTRMRKVVDDLLLLAQVSHPRHPLDRVPVDLCQVVRDIVALVASTATAKEQTLDVEVDPGALVVMGDASELDRLVGNLVSNAVKYTPVGGTVTVSVVRRGCDIVLRVADDGFGISEEDQLGLFRPFYRTSNPDALRETGSGLGLAIVATIVERHAGTVEVRSRLGHGTTFSVALPLS